MYRLISFFRKNRSKSSYLLNITFLLVMLWSIAYVSFEYFLPLRLDKGGYDFFTIGILLSITSIIPFINDFIFGFIQKGHSKKVLFQVSFLFLITTMLVFLSGHIGIFLIILALALYGFGFDLFDITAYSSIYDNSIESDRSTNISVRDVFESVGLVIGAIFAGFLVERSQNIILIVIIILFIIGFMISFKFKRVPKIKIESQRFSIKIIFKRYFSDFKKIGFSQTLFALLIISMITFWDGLFFGFEPLFIQNFTNPLFSEEVLGGFLLAFYILPIISLEYFFGKMEDRKGRKKFVIIGLLITIFGMIGISFSKDIIPLFLFVFITSSGVFGILNPAIDGFYESLSIKKLGKAYDGESVGLMEFFMNIGYILGPLIGGYLVYKLGFNLTFLVVAAMFIVVLLLSIIIFKKQK